MSRLKNTSMGMMKISVSIFVYTMLVVCMVLLATTGYEFGKDVFSAKGKQSAPGVDVNIRIESGAGRMDIADKLWDNGVIDNKLVFFVQTLLYCDEVKEFIPGDYVLNTSWSGEEIVETLTTPREKTE